MELAQWKTVCLCYLKISSQSRRPSNCCLPKLMILRIDPTGIICIWWVFQRNPKGSILYPFLKHGCKIYAALLPSHPSLLFNEHTEFLPSLSLQGLLLIQFLSNYYTTGTRFSVPLEKKEKLYRMVIKLPSTLTFLGSANEESAVC